MDYGEKLRQVRQERAEMVRLLRERGETVRSIAARIGVSSTTVFDDLRREDGHDDD